MNASDVAIVVTVVALSAGIVAGLAAWAVSEANEFANHRSFCPCRKCAEWRESKSAEVRR
jgi:hypothetical protein